MCGLPGVDIVSLGPNDLAASMGLVGQTAHPKVIAAMDTVIAAAKAQGRWVSTTANTPEQVQEAISRGADILIVSPALLVAQASRPLLDGLRR